MQPSLLQSKSRSELSLPLLNEIEVKINSLSNQKENISDVELVKKINKIVQYGKDLQREEREGRDIEDLYDMFLLEIQVIYLRIEELSSPQPKIKKNSSVIDNLKRKFF